MGGPRLSEEMIRAIHETWFRIRTVDYEPTAKEVRASVVRQLEKEGYTESEIPKIRTFQEYLRLARKRQINLQLESKADEQQPWNMQTLNEFPLPPESIPHLLQLWRYSINLGTEFTIRQAKWASRIYAQVKDTTELWLSSRIYSQEEELSLLSEVPMRIFELDNVLVMGRNEVETIKIPESKHSSIVTYSLKGLVFIAEDGGIMEEFLHALPCDIVNEDINYVGDYAYYLISLISALPSSSKYFPNVETRMVYLRHLSYLASVDNWQRFKPEEIRDIVVDLRKWVIETKNKIDKKITTKRSNPFPYENIRIKDQLFSTGPTNLYPVDIYKRVGFTNYDETNWRQII